MPERRGLGLHPMGRLPPSQKGDMSVCIWRVTPEPPVRSMAKVTLLGCSHPNWFALPLAWQCQFHRAQSLPPPCLHPLCSKATHSPEGWAGEVSPPSATAPGRAQWGLGHQGTRLAAPHPTYSQRGAQSRDTVPTHIHQDPSGRGPRGIPVPLPHGQGAGWAARQGTVAPQAKARMFPNLGQKQQAEGLLIASQGALVCLSILQQTRFAALIPIWK